MPASLPGSTLAENLAIPSAGPLVTFDPLSGPKAAPFDASKIDYSTGTPPGWNATTKIPVKVNDPANLSTGGLSTGIGFGSSGVPGIIQGAAAANKQFPDKNFNDDYTVGVTKPDNTAGTNSTHVYIGGGKSNAAGTPVPYTTGFALCAAGQGSPREATALGFPMKTVTAAAGVAAGAAVETGFVNASGVALVTGQSVFGVGTTSNVAPTELEELEAETPEEEVTFTEEQYEAAEEEEEEQAEEEKKGRTKRRR
jgi:hypothetical protein